LSVAAIAYVIMFHREEAVVVKAPPAQKKQAGRLKAVVKEKPSPSHRESTQKVSRL